MIRNRVAPGGALKQRARCARTHSGTGANQGGSHQKIESPDDTDTGTFARTDTGEPLTCIRNNHG
jgi:hypothetical protein